MPVRRSLALLCAGALAAPCCSGDQIILDYDCLKVAATGVRDCGGGGVTVGGLRVEAPPPCPKIAEVEVLYYRDRDGVPGFQAPPDELVDQRQASIATPTSVATIGSMANHNASGGHADSWSIEVVDENGGVTTTSGSF